MKKIYFFLIFASFILIACSTNQYRKSPHLKGIEELFFQKEFSKLINRIREKAEKGPKRDRVLYLMEAGSVFHVLGEWEKSNLAFLEADRIASETYNRISENLAGYLINDTIKDYSPEIFERILIKLYIAMNYLFLEEKEKSLKYFQQISIEQRDLRNSFSAYQQNNFARYLYAILAESLGQYEEARVQYNNLLLSASNSKNKFSLNSSLIKQNLYRLAVKLNDRADLIKFSNFTNEIVIYNEAMKRIPLFSSNKTNASVTNNLTETGQLVVIYEYGIGPFKTSRGKIGSDPQFTPFLNKSYLLTYLTRNRLAFDVSLLLSILKQAENPIPIYSTRKKYSNNRAFTFILNKKKIRSNFEDSFEEVVIRNFNDNYSRYVKNNISSILSKSVLTIASSQIVTQQVNSWLGLAINLLGSSLIAVNLKPDLRSWVFTYKNISLKVLHLMPGYYEITIPEEEKPSQENYLSFKKKKLTIKKNQTIFVKIRAF